MKSVEDRRRQLEARLAELDERLHEIEDALEQPAPRDDEDRATEREDDEVMEDLGVKGEREMLMIKAALKRIEDGEYGDCAKCGEAISEERLDLLPETPFCRRCAV